jgi:hypothetical protein
MASIAKEVLSDLNQERQRIYETLIRSVPSLVNNRDPFCWLLLCPSSNKLVFLSRRIREIIRFFFLLSGCLRTLLLVCNFLFFLWTKRERGNLTLANFTLSECAILPNVKANHKTLIRFRNRRKDRVFQLKINIESRVQRTCVKHITSYANKSLSRAL